MRNESDSIDTFIKEKYLDTGLIISEKTLRMMDSAIENLNAGKVSDVITFDDKDQQD